jgi:hypothetical protein
LSVWSVADDAANTTYAYPPANIGTVVHVGIPFNQNKLKGQDKRYREFLFVYSSRMSRRESEQIGTKDADWLPASMCRERRLLERLHAWHLEFDYSTFLASTHFSLLAL